ncbi:MAG: hypothetical protein WDO74_21685 [Pseudomonadota bacterium]
MLVKISAKGMVPTQRVVKLSALGRTFLDARLFPMAAPTKIDIGVGGTATSGRAKVVIAADTLKMLDGSTPSAWPTSA